MNARYARERRARKQERFIKLLLQKVLGLLMLFLSLVLIYSASTGISVEDRDATAVLITIPMGLYLLFTNKVILDF